MARQSWLELEMLGIAGSGSAVSALIANARNRSELMGLEWTGSAG